MKKNIKLSGLKILGLTLFFGLLVHHVMDWNKSLASSERAPVAQTTTAATTQTDDKNSETKSSDPLHMLTSKSGPVFIKKPGSKKIVPTPTVQATGESAQPKDSSAK